MQKTIETNIKHLYYFYGRVLYGYGPSMDPHRCGDPDEPCVTIKMEREVSDWQLVNREVIGKLPEDFTINE